MKKIYGNEYLLKTLESMCCNGRAAHTVLFYGEKGLGKKLLAKYYCTLLLCENPENGKPCGRCNSCKNADKGFHPDIVYAEASGKLGGYSVDTARAICTDAFIRPNNSSGRKIYIFTDCHNMDPRTQNTLLKIIEEPPEYAYFIFTTESKSDFLPTIISRCACFALSPCTPEQSAAALSEENYSEAEIKSAVDCFHGNIGMCLKYLSDENLKHIVDLTKSAADSIIRRDEYLLNVTLFSLGKDRNSVRSALSMLDWLIRDAAVLSIDAAADTAGCWRDGAVQLSRMLMPSQAAAIHRCIEKAWHTIECNVNIPLTLSAMCGEIIGNI